MCVRARPRLRAGHPDLRRAAAANGRSLGAELRAMMDEMMWQGIEAGYRRLAASREGMVAYQAEAAEWTSAGLGDLAATASDEYPEYNSVRGHSWAVPRGAAHQPGPRPRSSH
jgi:hypothetical protein